jgi:hypothetical protein
MPLKISLLVLYSLLILLVGIFAGYKWGQGGVETRVETRTVTRVEKIPGPTVEVLVPVPTPVTVRDTVLLLYGPDSPPVRLPVRQYTKTHQDTLIAATLNAEVAGELLDWSFTYTPVFERVTINTETTITRTLKAKPVQFGVGATAYRAPEFIDISFGPFVGLNLGNTHLMYSPRVSASHPGLAHMVGVSITF